MDQRSQRTDKSPPPIDWSRFDAITGEDIDRQIAEDPDVAPEADEAWFRKATLVLPKMEKS